MESVRSTLGSETQFQAKFIDQENADSYDSYLVMLKIVGFLGVLDVIISIAILLTLGLSAIAT